MRTPRWIPSALCVALVAGSALAQQPVPLPARPLPPPQPGFPSPEKKGLTTFDLDFPGGPPRDLVAAIQKAMGRPLNAIVPDQFADTKLPALTLRGVDVNQLFKSLELSSRKSEAVTSGGGFGGYQSYQIQTTYYGFRTDGPMNDDAIWYFYAERPALPLAKPVPQTACKFYFLGPYLERGLTVDDITTAIKTGWKMLGDTSTPTISFHKETKLLIAVGETSKLETIDAVLQALSPGSSPQGKPVPPPGAIPKPPAK